MATLVSKSESKKYLIFLNISFLSLVVCFFIIVHFYSPESLIVNSYNPSNRSSQPDCKGLASLDDYKSKCFYLKSNQPCVSQGYIDYVYLFYCTFGRFPHLCYFLLFLWLLVLFYVLGNTASEYFCSSLESLSKLLKLSPAIAGVTLLSFGNGAPDVFASIVSFMGNETSNVGLNTVLGGASFISCVVVGVISITMHPRHIRVNKSDFVRDICFFLLALVWLLVILSIGEIDIWGAMGFSFLYVVYVCAVYVSHSRWKKSGNDPEIDASSSFGGELSTPILYGIEKVEVICIEDGALLGDSGVEEIKKRCFWLSSSASCGMFLCILQMPLYLPRRLTIPVVCEERWSKPFAVTSVTLAPLLLAVLWNSQMENLTSKASLVIYGVGLLFGTVLGDSYNFYN
ncbi:hypothetical protein L1049_008404 [Liquidambar formosana]|uniref:Sodium/calcium exchanger membrane region domain-containing protein n=1 Tax=Liquidambar formosana TaxID=63359 RepID=A0AAP0S9C8_LIQFO